MYQHLHSKVKNGSSYYILGISVFLFAIIRLFIEKNYTINSHGFSSSDILQSFITSAYNLFICCIPLLIFKSKAKIYLSLFLIILGLSNLLNFVHIFQYETSITMGAFAVMFETTPQEAIEYIKLLSTSDIIIAGIIAFFPIVPFLLLFNKKVDGTKIIIHSLIIFLVALFFVGIQGLSNERKINYTHFSFEHSNIYNDAKRVAYYLREKRKLNKIQDKRNKITIDAAQINTIDSLQQTYVLVIGESVAKNHLGLYGYHRKTTPTLDTLSNLKVFQKVITPATQTRTAIMMMLTRAHVEDINLYYESESIINIAEKAGFHTTWISNQMMYGISDTETSVLAKDANEVVFVNTDWNTNSLDEKILPYYNQCINDSTHKKKLIILHLLGSHFDYNKRYPNNNPHYQLPRSDIYPDHIKNNKYIQLIDHYDNSLRYTNDILYQIIEPLTEHNGIASLVFLSDHGQEVFDRSAIGMGHGSPILVKETVDIPFFWWHNNAYLHVKEQLYDERFLSFLNRPFSSQDLFYTLIDMMQINCSKTDSSRSLINVGFKERPLTILNSDNKIIPYETLEH